MTYEDLALMNNFSDDEKTKEFVSRDFKQRKLKRALNKIRKAEDYVRDLKSISADGFTQIVETVSQIDENFKKI